MITEAVILCGGLGTRLREETEFRPKPMVNIGEYPILWHIMKRYSAYGVKRFILCLGYKGTHIRDYFLNYRYQTADFSLRLASGDIIFDRRTAIENWEVVLAETGAETQTGSRIARAMHHVLGTSFYATYGDGVADVDIAALAAQHERTSTAGTLTAVLQPSRFGELETTNGMIRSFLEKPQLDSSFINGGFMVFHKARLAPYLPADPVVDFGCSLEADIMPKLATDGQLSAYEHRGFWQCMDTHREMEMLNTIYHKGSAPWLMKDGMLITGKTDGS